MKEVVRPIDGFRYYSYILTYVDDILVMHHDKTMPLNAINIYLKMKPESMGDPDIYLDDKLHKCTMSNGVVCWSLSDIKYVQ